MSTLQTLLEIELLDGCEPGCEQKCFDDIQSGLGGPNAVSGVTISGRKFSAMIEGTLVFDPYTSELDGEGSRITRMKDDRPTGNSAIVYRWGTRVLIGGKQVIPALN